MFGFLFEVYGLACRVEGLGFRVYESGVRVERLAFSV